MSNKCTCSNIPFTPECRHCYENLCKYINDRDNEIIKIYKKNIKENKCKCIYIAKYSIYTCDSCDYDFNKWKNKT